MLEGTFTRVEKVTPSHVNEKICRMTAYNIDNMKNASAEEIHRRIHELKHEWDIERAIEVSASSFSLLGLCLGAKVDKRWYMLPAVIAGFLMQHALTGWCPPVSVFRRMGVRTASEIQYELNALRFMLGKFDHLPKHKATP